MTLDTKGYLMLSLQRIGLTFLMESVISTFRRWRNNPEIMNHMKCTVVLNMVIWLLLVLMHRMIFSQRKIFQLVGALPRVLRPWGSSSLKAWTLTCKIQQIKPINLYQDMVKVVGSLITVQEHRWTEWTTDIQTPSIENQHKILQGSAWLGHH